MVIPVFYPAFDYGGPIPVALNFARGLVSRGHEVTVWTTNLISIKGSKLSTRTEVRDIDGIRVVYLNSVVRYRWTGIAPDAFRYVWRELSGFDVVHVYGFREFTTVVAALGARALGKPYVLQALGTVPRLTRSMTKKLLFDALFGRTILHGAASLIAKTPADRDPYLASGVPAKRIALIPNGISLPTELEEVRKGEFRDKYGVDKDEMLFLFVGRIHPVKGVDLLTRAFARLDGHARLAIVGPDEGYRSELERLAAKSGLHERIIFTGPLYGAQKWAAYRDADVYVKSSVRENFGMTVLEAMVCDMPVIVTEGCGIATWIHDVAGLATPYEEKGLADAMRRLQVDVRLRKELAAGGKRLIKERFSWEPLVEDLESLYERLLTTTKAGLEPDARRH